MLLKKIRLSRYRNFEDLELVTEGKVNLFVGSNAQGKTNLLESIFVLAISKSHRTHRDKELIRWNDKDTILHGEIERKYGTYKLDLQITQQGKRAKVNGLEKRKLSDFVGVLNVVMFAPEDLDIVKGAPGVRRRFLDMEIGQIQPSYIYNLQQYQKVLIQRNNFLKQPRHANKINYDLFNVWSEQLVQYGVKIMKSRQTFIRRLQFWSEKIHAGITNNAEQIKIVYQPSFPFSEAEDESVLLEEYMLKLVHVREQELKRGISLIGPHRDDLLFFINDREVQTFGSQGQQRTAALSLKLAEIELIREEAGEYPILLLDDVLSELDQHRQTQLIETFQNKVQTFITTTGIESVNMKKLRDASVYHVIDGKVDRG